MSPQLAFGIVVVVMIMILILKRSFRSKVAESIPYVNYVDETLLDLVRTRQTSTATQYYQEHTGATSEEAEKIIYYLIQHPESLMLMVRLQGEGQEPLYSDATLLDYLEQGRVSKAVLYYADKTGAEPVEAQIAVGAIAINPEMKFLPRQDTLN
jgi:hypothetical protein